MVDRMMPSPKDVTSESLEPCEVLPYVAKAALAGVSRVRIFNGDANPGLSRWDQYNQKGP